MALVELKVDIFPYCKGDVVELNDKERKRVDKVAEERDLERAYVTAQKGTAPTKAQLLEQATAIGLEVDPKATNASIQEAIDAKLAE